MMRFVDADEFAVVRVSEVLAVLNQKVFDGYNISENSLSSIDRRNRIKFPSIYTRRGSDHLRGVSVTFDVGIGRDFSRNLFCIGTGEALYIGLYAPYASRFILCALSPLPPLRFGRKPHFCDRVRWIQSCSKLLALWCIFPGMCMHIGQTIEGNTKSCGSWASVFDAT